VINLSDMEYIKVDEIAAKRKAKRMVRNAEKAAQKAEMKAMQSKYH
jgi:hypothetical protein